MDKYVRIKKIGEGAFGRAVLVRNKHDASQYVVKEINIIKMSPKEREDARKEVAVLAQLKHPNIVAYRDSFEESGGLYIVMDYCSGGDLYGRINAQKGQLFSEDQILDWFVQMCLAIKHIHDRKILHRDIKSQNIFLTSQETVKLGDFGIAKVLSSTVELARTCIGTPYYLSPEICENKPYNNKSDVWSLGCVLYELTTLKHAFEAGNMKNLVLKIIRGSYPPVSSKYSYELRGLIAQLFKRAPRERPSINSILKKSFVSQKVPKFLSNEQLADEFSHTVMHGKKLARKLPPPPQPAASRPSSAVGQRPSSARKYDPAKVYGAPLSKSKENRGSTPDLRKRPGSAGAGPQAKRSPSNSSLNKKKQQFIEKEKKRREEDLKKEIEKRHKELIEKQKVARINKSREENWRGIVNSLGSDESEKEKKQEVNNDMGEQVRWQPPKPQVQQPPVPFYNHAPDNRPVSDDKGRYEHYHEYLDKLQERKRQEGVPPAQVPVAAYMAAPRPLPQAPQPNPIWRQAPRVPDATPLAIKQAEKDRFLGQQAAERARLVEEFVQRKKEAAHNKQRGHAAIHGTPAPQIPVQNRGPESAAGQQRPPSGISNRNRDEHKGAGKGKRVQPVNEYLEKLRQIRMQNFNERKNVQGQMKEELDAEARRKKAEALRQQSEDWAEQRKNALEQKRKELLERERVMRENREKGVRPEQRPLPKPAPGLPITGVMNAIGVKPKVVQDVLPASRVPGITGAMEAIGAIPRVVVEERREEPPAEPRPKTPHQQKKESILKKLNQKGPPRGKWGAPAIPEFEPEEKESERSKWGAGDAFNFGNMALEETASQMEVTSAQDKVVCNPDSSRRQWKSPDSSVISSLQDRPIVEGTVTIASDKSDESVSPPVSAKPNPTTPPNIGSTFTIPKSPIQKGTVIIKTAQQTEGKNVSSEPGLSSSNAIQEAESSASQEAYSTPSCSSSSEKTSDQTFPANDQIESHIKSEQKHNADIEKKDEVSKPSIPYRPPLPAKPKDKPLNLPTPKLLPKPDKPMEFVKAPVSSASNSQGEGSLFEKVQLEDEEEYQEGKEERENNKIAIEDVEEEETKKDEKTKDKQRTGVALGLTSGSFDINNTQMLRTCSEPDLSSLFRTTAKESPQVKRKSLDMSSVQEEDEQYFEELLSSFENALKLDNPEEGADNPKEDKEVEVEEEDQEQDQEEDEDYEDLLSVRETMKSLLLQDDDDDGKSMKFSLSSSCEDTSDYPIGVDKMKSTEEGKSRTDRKDRDDGEGNTEDGDDEEEVEEDEEEEEQDSVENEEEIDSSHPHRSVSVDNDNPQSPDERAEMLAELFQSDEESDSEFQDGGGENGEDYDLFSRLEESRAFLEKELGCQKFLKVYKTVQALQEDEDENMEDGARIAIEMLGKDKEHLYPKIFQLVMADTAFTEDSTVDIESLAASFSLF